MRPAIEDNDPRQPRQDGRLPARWPRRRGAWPRRGRHERRLGGDTDHGRHVGPAKERQRAGCDHHQHRGHVERVLGGDRRHGRDRRNAPFHQEDLRRLAREQSQRRQIAERVAHDPCAERVGKRQLSFGAHHPGPGARGEAQAAEDEDHGKPPADGIDARLHVAPSDAADGEIQQSGAGEGEEQVDGG